jgi:predicted dithiol-disulfide oxidoreductase (DUF899 family)
MAMALAGIGLSWSGGLTEPLWRRDLPRPSKQQIKETSMSSALENRKVVSRVEWLAARKELFGKEKELTHLRDELSRQRRELPWVKVERNYVFDTPTGQRTLGDLFQGRSQLIIYHFMFGPEWREGCVGCSFLSDHVDGALLHLLQRDVAYVAVSRAPLAKIETFKKRMGWKFQWVSSHDSDFNYDYQVSFPKEEIDRGKVYYNFAMQELPSEEMSGTSVFYKDAGGSIYHTYSCYARSGEGLLGAYYLMDLLPKGRDEKQDMNDWLRHHDRYAAGGLVIPAGRDQEADKPEPCCHQR